MIYYKGLSKRNSYDETVNYIQKDQPKIKYPNRQASFLLNSIAYQSLLGLDGLDEQDEQIKKEKNAQAVGSTQHTQYYTSLNAQQSPHPLGPSAAAPSVAGSEYSDPAAFSISGSTPLSSSHGAPNENHWIMPQRMLQIWMIFLMNSKRTYNTNKPKYQVLLMLPLI